MPEKVFSSPDLSADAISAQIKGSFWKNIYLYRSVDSTNELASSLSGKNKIESNTVIIADQQESGKGRLGRKWISPAGRNIYMSIMIKPNIPPKDAAFLTLLSAAACIIALIKTTGEKISIKWPNDLMVSDKKIGGILTEVRSGSGRIKTAIIGIGINVNITKKELPPEIRAIATSLKEESGIHYSRTDLIVRILKEFEHWYHIFLQAGKAQIIEKWTELSSTPGKMVRVITGSETLSGLAEDIDDEGRLILRLSSGEIKKISSGDITMLR
jgi:BirA family transcriptional regulator, biotin operon repressor / biotin---[acetyl-CoA-carboxylase] ligase